MFATACQQLFSLDFLSLAHTPLATPLIHLAAAPHLRQPVTLAPLQTKGILFSLLNLLYVFLNSGYSHQCIPENVLVGASRTSTRVAT
jgi:hypothetical protein